MKLAKRYSLFGVQCGPIENTWIIHDGIVLMTSSDVTHEEECYKLEMTIPGAGINDDTPKPWHISMDRWVSMMILVTTFTIHTNIVYY
jgi:hypothetical protein